MAVSKRLRHEVMRRDSHTCRYCGGTAPDVKLTIDHVTPTTLGGSDDPSNLVTACADCNAGKSATPPDAALVADVDQRAVEWGQAMDVAMGRRMSELHAERARTENFNTRWEAWGSIPREGNWRDSIRRFLAFGLDDEFLADAVETAMGNRQIRTNDTWRYFCGICWKEIKQVQGSIVPGTHSSFVPRQQPDTPFDHMAMFDDFVGSLVRATGGNEHVQKFVSFYLSEVMQVAHSAWAGRLGASSVPLEDDQDSLEEAATDAGRNALLDHLSGPMQEIKQWYATAYPAAPPRDDGEFRWLNVGGDYATAAMVMHVVVMALGGDRDVRLRADEALRAAVVSSSAVFNELCLSQEYVDRDSEAPLLHKAWDSGVAEATRILQPVASLAGQVSDGS